MGYESCLQTVSKLSPEQKNELKAHAEAHCYHDSKALINYVRYNYGIKYSHSGMVDLLHRLGFTYKKPNPSLFAKSTY